MRNNTVSRLLVDQLTAGQLQWVDLMEDFDVVLHYFIVLNIVCLGKAY